MRGKMIIRAVQQFQLRTAIGTEKKARATLQAMIEAGYTGIELNGFMIKKMSPIVRILCRAAGMPIGKSGKLDWIKLVKESGLEVASVHEDLNGILRNPEEMIAEANAYGTKYIVITGMHHFDYSNRQMVEELIEKLNRAGEALLKGGIHLLYHNHNCEFRKVEPDKTAYSMIIEKTDPRYVNFEFDSYWPTEAGCNTLELMNALGSRMKLYHINDRGTRVSGRTGSILESDSMELGYGNMDLVRLVEEAKRNGVEAVILESHKNWIDKSPVKSFQLSSKFMNENVI